ncbi:MAG: hypothetical protein AAGN66_00730 [Acidobacteriota bacterium]
MKTFGYLLIIGGFIGAAYFTVLDPVDVPPVPFLAFLVASAAGVALVRVEAHRSANRGEHLAASIEALGQSLERLAEESSRFDAEKDSIDVYDLRLEVERRFPEHLDAFVEARESLARRFGLQAYAEVMNAFAAGERYLNRVWSASTDGWIDEAHTYAEKAKRQFQDALETFRALPSG